MQNPIYEAFIQAGVEAGYPRTVDYNGHQQEGFAAMHMTVGNGSRCSAAKAYLHPALKRANLKLIKHASVERIDIENGATKGVRYSVGGNTQQATARREVILSAGSIGFPVILQHRFKQPITLNGKLDPFSKLLIGAQWLLMRNGLGATNHFESCAFVRSNAGAQWPDIQYHFLPGAMRYDGRAAFEGHGFLVQVGPNKPDSRGTVKTSGPTTDAKPQNSTTCQQKKRRIPRESARQIRPSPAKQPWILLPNFGVIAPITCLFMKQCVSSG